MATTAPGLFDEPFSWRLEAARAMGLRGKTLLAALSPGAAYPSVLRSMIGRLPQPCATLVDLGAGAGGSSEWLRTASGACVVAVEPSNVAAITAARTFPDLLVVRGDASTTGLRTGSADAVTLCGVLSLIDDAAPVFAEVRRLLRPGGVLAVADLFAADHHDVVSGPNTFRAIETVDALLQTNGFALTEVGVGAPVAAPDWAAVAAEVDEWIHEHRHMCPEYDVWRADQAHLDRHVTDGAVLGGCVVGIKSPDRTTGPADHP